jgi:hypothetical protein
MRKWWIFVLMSLASSFIWAQYVEEALVFSSRDRLGTARFLSLGGAMSPVGGDFSAIGINPAGLAVFNSEEINLSLNQLSAEVQSSYNLGTRNTTDSRFTVSNLSISGIMGENLKNGWTRFSLGLSLQRVADFNSVVHIRGFNDSSTRVDAFLESAQGTPVNELSDFDLYPAWFTYLIDTLGSPSNYYSNAPGGLHEEISRTETRGGIHEFGIQIAALQGKHLFLGASLNFPLLSYEMNRTYSEDYGDTSSTGLESWTYEDELTVDGSGANFKIGAIYAPLPWIRLSGAIHTPTFYDLEERYVSQMTTAFTGDLLYEYTSQVGFFEYRLTSPWRFNLGGALFAGSHGFISADVEWVDFSSMKLRSDFASFTTENALIESWYQSAMRWSLGTEWRFGPAYVRGGTSHTSSAYVSEGNPDAIRSYSGGVGIRINQWSFDLGLRFTDQSRDQLLYLGAQGTNPPPAAVEQSRNTFILSASYRL